MKKTLFLHSLLGVGMTMLLASTAAADRHHHYDDDDDHHSYVTYERRVTYVRDDYADYGRVLDVQPIYRRVAIDVPRESCHVETVARQERRGGDSFAGTLVGGLIGASIGHEISHGRGAATAAGGIIGATIGNEAASGSRVVTYRDQEVCRRNYRTEYEERLVGYDVSYSYHGRIYQTRTDRHPGERIPVGFRSRDD